MDREQKFWIVTVAADHAESGMDWVIVKAVMVNRTRCGAWPPLMVW
jgi:hypothetical protein